MQIFVAPTGVTNPEFIGSTDFFVRLKSSSVLAIDEMCQSQ